jgi:hypothetical protein
VQRIVEDNGFWPPGGGTTWQTHTSAAKDALWALDFFVVRTLHGQFLQVMAIIDVHTRELVGLRTYDGWDVDSTWTMRTLAAALSESKRSLTAVMHDRAPRSTPGRSSASCGCLRWTSAGYHRGFRP